MTHRPRFASLIVTVAILLACADPTPTPMLARRRARTQHLNITFPDGQESNVQEFLIYAEDVYGDVNDLFGGALPPTIDVAFVRAEADPPADGDIVVSLAQLKQIEQIYARELVNLIFRLRRSEGAAPDCCRFFYAGLAEWVEERYEWKKGPAEPRALRAAYGYTQGWADLDHLQHWDEMLAEIPADIATAIGHTFVAHFINVYGQEGLLRLLDELSRSTDVCFALDAGGFDCAAFVDSWQTLLQLESEDDDFTTLPRITADLIVGGAGRTRDVGIAVHITNPERVSYQHCLTYTIADDPTETCDTSVSPYLRTQIPLGKLSVGASVRWHAAVWSETLQTWITTPWQEQRIP